MVQQSVDQANNAGVPAWKKKAAAAALEAAARKKEGHCAVVQQSVDQANNAGLPTWRKKAAAAAMAAATKKKCEEQGGGSDTVPEWKRKLLEMKKKKLQELESIKANAQGEKAEPVEVSASTQAPEIREAEHTFVTQDPFDPVQDPHSGDVVHSLSSGDVKVLEKAIQAEIIES